MNKDVLYLIGEQMSPNENRRMLTNETELKSIFKYYEIPLTKFSDLDKDNIFLILLEFSMNRDFSKLSRSQFQSQDAFDIYELVTSPTLSKIKDTKFRKIGYIILERNIQSIIRDTPVSDIKTFIDILKKYNFKFNVNGIVYDYTIFSKLKPISGNFSIFKLFPSNIPSIMEE